jgi:PHD/YefM family antitoxin component YafN of YafNO toxin-antitoxin module
MTTLSVHDAIERLPQLLADAAESHEPIQIVGNTNNGVLVSKSDWRRIHETSYLISIPGMREPIPEGLAEPIERCAEDPGW